MMHSKLQKTLFGVGLTVLFLLPNNFYLSAASSIQTEIDALNNKISVKKLEIDQLKKKIDNYTKNIEAKRNEAANLKNQISILDDKIGQLELMVEQAVNEIDTINLELQNVTLQILETDAKIKEKKDQLTTTIQLLAKTERKTPLEVLVLYDSFSDFYNRLRTVDGLEKSLQRSLAKINEYHTELLTQKAEQEKKNQDLIALKKDLEHQKLVMEDRATEKGYLIAQTRASEQEFSKLLASTKSAMDAANSDIVAFDRQVRKKLEEKGIEPTGSVSFIWPVNSQNITSIFHDPDYPFRNSFPHTGVDIAVPQGTPFKVAESGYVARVQYGGARGLSYIMVVHTNGLTSVYMHNSKAYVKVDDYVARGQVIGASGGIPGTSGAGPYSTGAHLHFEMRKDGIPVNPFKYLP